MKARLFPWLIASWAAAFAAPALLAQGQAPPASLPESAPATRAEGDAPAKPARKRGKNPGKGAGRRKVPRDDEEEFKYRFPAQDVGAPYRFDAAGKPIDPEGKARRKAGKAKREMGRSDAGFPTPKRKLKAVSFEDDKKREQDPASQIPPGVLPPGGIPPGILPQGDPQPEPAQGRPE